jgi:hypothetical protein
MLFCGGGNKSTPRDDPLIDIERLLVDYAWNELAEPSLTDRMMKNKKYKLEVNWGYLHITHHVKSFEPWSGSLPLSGQRDDVRGNHVTRRDLCLFRTEFKNESNEAQNFTFKTERTTTSRCEVTLMQGLRMGANVDVKISIPPVRRTVCEVTFFVRI